MHPQEFHAVYRSWLERLATLSTTALALLVSLQKSYVSPNPRDGWLLAGCWGLLCLATLCAALALYGEAQAHHAFLRRARAELQAMLPEIPALTLHQVKQRIGATYGRPWLYRAAGATSFVAFATALAALTALTLYASLNL